MEQNQVFIVQLFDKPVKNRVKVVNVVLFDVRSSVQLKQDGWRLQKRMLVVDSTGSDGLSNAIT